MEGILMAGFIITLIPAGLLCGGVVLLIQSFVKKDTYHYDQENLWEEYPHTLEDFKLK
jgi:hypothetical protein